MTLDLKGRPYTLLPTMSANHYRKRNEGCQLNQCHHDCRDSYHDPWPKFVSQNRYFPLDNAVKLLCTQFKTGIKFCCLGGRSKVIQFPMIYDHRDTRPYLIAYSAVVNIRTTCLYRKDHRTIQCFSEYRATFPLCRIRWNALTSLQWSAELTS